MNATQVLEIERIEQTFVPAAVLPERLTWQEFLRFGEDTTHAEWIDGRVIVLFSGSTKHQEIVSFLDRVIGFYAETHNLGRLFVAPYAMKLSKQRRGREPDLLFVSREREHLLKKTFLDGAADLAVEIISPESIERDSVTKFVEYEAAGIKEYWLIDETNKTAVFYELDKQKRYKAAMLRDNKFYSKVLPNFFLRVEWLWCERLSAVEALRELGII